MREAFGGTFMMYVFIIFLAVYIVFIGIAFNYAKAFRVKNRVIDIIEQDEGIASFDNTSGTIGDINTYLQSASYYVSGITDNVCTGYDYVNENLGYCIDEISVTTDGITSKYYSVQTFVKLEIPYIKWFSYTIGVKGETRKIERINA